MYFSMQLLRQEDSRDESDVPGVGMHFSKQFSLTLLMSSRAFDTAASCCTCCIMRFLRSAEEVVGEDEEEDENGLFMMDVECWWSG